MTACSFCSSSGGTCNRAYMFKALRESMSSRRKIRLRISRGNSIVSNQRTRLCTGLYRRCMVMDMPLACPKTILTFRTVFYSLFADFLLTFCRSFAYLLHTFCRLFTHFLQIFCIPFADFLLTFCRSFHYL